MDRVLGYYLADAIFSEIKYVNDLKGLDEIDDIIKLFCEIPCNIRKKTAEIVFKYLKRNVTYGKNGESFFSNNKDIGAVVECAVPLIKKYFEDLCYFQWWSIMKDSTDRETAISEILEFCEEEIAECFKMPEFGCEIKKYYYDKLNLSEKVELAEESSEIIFLYKILNGADVGVLECSEMNGNGEIKMEEIQKRLKKEIEDNKKSEILKNSYKLTPLKMYAYLHKYIVVHSLNNIREESLNFFSFHKI